MSNPIKIFDITTPTPQQMKKTAEKWWERHKNINFWAWNEVLQKHTYDYTLFRVDEDFIEKILNSPEHPEDAKYIINRLKDTFNPYLKKWGNKTFFKLITRSPKDYMMDVTNYGKPMPTDSAELIFESMMNSMRTFEDLCLLLYLPYPQFVLRPYINFHPSTEWRVLIDKGKIVGISQYYYNEVFDYKNPEEIKERIENFITNIVIPNVKEESFVADIVLDDEIKLLELNPFGLSDPCLFYSYDKLDGRFLYNKS